MSSMLQAVADKLNNRTTILLAVTTTAAVGASFYLWRTQQRRHQVSSSGGRGLTRPSASPDEAEVECVGEVSQLFVYPVKSLAGISVKAAECTDMGLKWESLRDRQMLVTDGDTGRFVTMRQLPQMALIRCQLPEDVSLRGKYVQLTAPGCQPLLVPLNLPKGKIPGKVSTTTQVWDLDGIPIIDFGDEVAEWITKFINSRSAASEESPNKTYRLAALDLGKNFRTEVSRPVLRDALTGVGFVNPVAFSDISTYMIACQTSLDDLNDKISVRNASITSAEIQRFRPNILVSGTRKAFEESDWDIVQIGDVDCRTTFRKLKDCHRCILTTVSPELGEKSVDMEPLKTLKEYRIYDGDDPQWKKIYGQAPLFGINVSIKNPGHAIKVGDKVFATKRSKS